MIWSIGNVWEIAKKCFKLYSSSKIKYIISAHYIGCWLAVGRKKTHLSFCFGSLLLHLFPQLLHLLLSAIEDNDILIFEWIPTLQTKMTVQMTDGRHKKKTKLKTVWSSQLKYLVLQCQFYPNLAHRSPHANTDWGTRENILTRTLTGTICASKYKHAL